MANETGLNVTVGIALEREYQEKDKPQAVRRVQARYRDQPQRPVFGNFELVPNEHCSAEGGPGRSLATVRSTLYD